MMDQHLRGARRIAQPWTRSALVVLGTILSGSAYATPHFVTFINDADRTVTEIDAAPAGTHRWHVLDIGGPLTGGLSGQATVRFNGTDACKQDLTISYRGMAPLTVTGFDICRTHSLHLGKALTKAMQGTATKERLR